MSAHPPYGRGHRALSTALLLATLLASGCPLQQTDGDADGDADASDVADSAVGADAIAADVATCTMHGDCPETGEPCKIALCAGPAGCVVVLLPDKAWCDDGDACTAGDSCTDGKCAPSGPMDCDDGDPCTADTCAGGTCKHGPGPDSTPCDDGNKCTQSDACKAGKCVGTDNICQCQVSNDCAKMDDGDACNGTLYCSTAEMPFKCVVNPATVVSCDQPADTCTSVVCAPATGKCGDKKLADGTPCDDGDGCTAGDVCKAGACNPGTKVCCQTDADCAPAEDGDACNGTLYCNQALKKCALNPLTIVTCPTVDNTACLARICQAKTGGCPLMPLAKGSACDDDNACTPDEACDGGNCVAMSNTCDCVKTADCAAKEDGDACNGTLYCDMTNNKCAVNPASIVDCPTVDDTECLRNTCQSKISQCAMKAETNGTACGDGNICTVSDGCLDGSCSPGPNVCACAKDADCSKYEDGDLCNGSLFCDKSGVAPTCAVNPATVVSCPNADDGPCKKNTCVGKTGGCKALLAADYLPCDADGTPCTKGDHCDKGTCQAGPNLCGCKSDGDCGAFQSANKCATPISCDTSATPSVCAPNPAAKTQCDDAKDSQCSKNLCNPTTGKCAITHVHEAQPCTEKTPCAGPAYCNGGSCLAAGKGCDDGNACTKDSCLANKGVETCAHAAVDCDDANVCTNDICDGGSGECIHLPNQVTCSDGDLCAPASKCQEGACKKTAPVNCGDGSSCTTDSCVVATGKCAHKAVAGPCDDGDGCTVGDACAAGKCAPGKAVTCTDGDPCTDDSCVSATGKCKAVSKAALASCGGASLCVPALAGDPDLLGHWSFDDCKGTDSSSKGYHGKLVNAPACVNGKVGKALDLDGKGYVDVTKGGLLEADMPALTFGGWFLFKSPGSYEVAMGRDSAWLLSRTKGDITTAIAHDAPSNWAWLGKVAVAQDKWVHVVAVYSGKVVEHYVDGLKIAAYALDGKVVGKDCRFAIGARGVGCGKIWQILPGMVDEIFVLRRALEAEEVASLAMGNWKGGCQAAIKCSDLAQCDDANNCTDDSCDPKTGNCLHTLKAIGAPCDDGNPCTTPDTCKETSCVSGPAMKCAAGTTCKLGKCE